MEIREIRPVDHAALVALWHGVFGDPEDYVETFLRFLPEMGGGVAAFEEGRPLGAAYMITALQLREGENSRRCGYLYAVAVRPEARGRGVGAALSQAAAALGRKRGAALICTWPAEPGLYAWYERVLGARCALYRSCRERKSAPGPAVRPLDPAAYAQRREELLAGRPHLSLEPAAMGFEAVMLGAYGGGLFSVGDGLAAACVDGDTAEIHELLGASDAEAAALGAALGAETARLWQPAAQGRPYLSFAPDELPRDTVWNLAFD